MGRDNGRMGVTVAPTTHNQIRTRMPFKLFSWLDGLFSKKRDRPAPDPHLSSMQKRAEDIRASGLPLQRQEEALLRLGRETVNMDESLAIRAHADYVGDVMANRNTEGAALERLHRPDKAIELYEANVRDQYKAAYSYERLLALYSSSGRFQDASRVCQAYLEHGDEDKKARFRQWLTESRQS